jgi:hypothetical protein
VICAASLPLAQQCSRRLMRGPQELTIPNKGD